MFKKIKSFIEDVQGYEDVDFIIILELNDGHVKFYMPVTKLELPAYVARSMDLQLQKFSYREVEMIAPTRFKKMDSWLTTHDDHKYINKYNIIYNAKVR
jgi:hypothetical protein